VFPGNPSHFPRRAGFSPEIPGFSTGILRRSHGIHKAPGDSQDVLLQQFINSKAEIAVVVGQASSLSPTVNDLEKHSNAQPRC
jgi:hypothetical protein